MLPRLSDHGYRLRHRNRGAGLHNVLEQGAAGASHQLHDRFVGLNLRQHVTYRNGLAFLLLPFDQAPFLHGRGEGFHDDLG
jgi:hypothetical protein